MHRKTYEQTTISAVPMGHRYRRRHSGRGRIPKPINVSRHPTIEGLTPVSGTARALYTSSTRTIYIDSAEIEAQRLVDIEGLSQKEAGVNMGVSRGTVWRLLHAARKKSAQSLVEGRTLLILDEGNKRNSQKTQMHS
jgi:predicted DNA-binding protein (UPF0251 family)